MLRRLAVLIAALVLATPAGAVTRFVSPTGSGTACTSGSPCSMTQANSVAAPGDVISMASGSYSVSPNPTGSGTAGNPIEYRGDPNNWSGVVFSSLTGINSQDNIVFRYFTVNSTNAAGMRLDGQLDNWRIAGVIVRGDLLIGGYNNGTIESCYVMPPLVGGTLGHNYLSFGGQACPINGGGAIANTVLRQNNFYLRSEAGHQYCFSADPIVKFYGAMKTNLTLSRNRFLIVMGPGSDGGSKRGYYLAEMDDSHFDHNMWMVKDSANTCTYGSGCITSRIRDHFNRNVFDTDTLWTEGSGAPNYLSSQGEPNDRTTEGDSKWINCYFYNKNGGNWEFSWGARDDSLINSVFVSDSHRAENAVVRVPSVAADGGFFMDHCTVADYSDPSIAFVNGPPVEITSNSSSSSPVTVTNNIFYRQMTTTGSNTAAEWITLAGSRTYTVNNNLFFYRAGIGRSIYGSWNGGGGALSNPGTGSTWTTASGKDANSKYGSPRFADSTFATFNPTLTASSAAIGMGTFGTDAGARQFSVQSDFTPPAAITTLGYTGSSVSGSTATMTLLWYTVGDDDLVGTAANQDLRWSTAPITSGNFASATAITGLPSPQVAGTLQVKTVTGMPLNQNLYFAIRATDEVGNVGAISNVIVVQQASAPLVTGSSVCQ